MSNIDIAKKFYASIEAGNMNDLKAILADDFVFEHKAAPQPADKKEFINMIKGLRAGIPDWRFNVQHWEDGTPVRSTVKITGSHTKTLDLATANLPVVPATQKKIQLPPEKCSFEIKDGKIHAHRVEAVSGGGVPGIYNQIGVKLPAQQATKRHA